MSIDRELEALKPFGDALREENRLLFEKMMAELGQETLKKASLAKDPFEVVAMALILNQQKIMRVDGAAEETGTWQDVEYFWLMSPVSL